MTRQICLPRCVHPVFPAPCNNGQKVCCIEWTMPCGGETVTLRWDGAFVLLPPFYGFAIDPGGVLGEGCGRSWIGDEFCFFNIEGDTRWYSVYLEVCGDHVGLPRQTCGEVGYIGHGRAGLIGDCPDAFFGCDETAFRGADEIAICDIKDLVGGEDQGCSVWPELLTELSGLEEGPTTTVNYDASEGAWFKRTSTYHAKPYIRWYCAGFNRIVWEVGWDVFEERYYSGPLASEPDTTAVEPWVAVCDGGQVTRNSCWVHVGSYPISTGESDSNWHLGGPFELQNSVGTGGDTFRSTITPVACNYEPCGESLDCFADCISGTKGCDGVTPAHKPVIYFTLINSGCCLAGTYPLTFGGTGGYGYHGSVTCVDAFGVTHIMEITLNCGSTSGAPGDGGVGGLVFLHLDFYAIFGFTDHVHYDIGFEQNCDGGALVEATGTLSEIYCGLFSGADWAIHS